MDTTTSSNTPVAGISGYWLKMIAVITMLIDHTAASILERMLQIMPAWGPITMANCDNWYRLDVILRGIGRMAFPIYCFLLVEGFIYTHSKAKYALRLFIFALISEIPFDMALFKSYWDMSHNNVFFTLWIGLLTIWATDFVMVHMADGMNEKIPPILLRILRTVLMFGIFLLGCGLASKVFCCDYGMSGICAIYVLYMLRNQRQVGFATAVVLLGIMSGTLELLALLMLIPMHFYNGTRGKQHKYFFYAFYPVHLLFLAIICQLIGLGVGQGTF
jgi:hypothetical protein